MKYLLLIMSTILLSCGVKKPIKKNITTKKYLDTLYNVTPDFDSDGVVDYKDYESYSPPIRSVGLERTPNAVLITNTILKKGETVNNYGFISYGINNDTLKYGETIIARLRIAKQISDGLSVKGGREIERVRVTKIMSATLIGGIN